MKSRYSKLIYEDERGITFEATAKQDMTFEFSEGTNGELRVKARKIGTGIDGLDLPAVSAGEYAEELSVYTDKHGLKAAVLPGWTVSGVSSENTIWGQNVSLVIYRIPKEKTSKLNWDNPKELEGLKRTYSQLVWCPVGLLEPNGTLDGEKFNKRFGRRNYRVTKFSKDEFHETPEGMVLAQSESMEKYGGFYFTRYNLSRNLEEEILSVKGAMPLVNIDYGTARISAITASIKEDRDVVSHLMYGAEYDSILAWLIESGAKTQKDITADSTEWGNYKNTKNSPDKVVETGSSEEWCTNNVYDLAGNVAEWTQEEYGEWYRVIRGGYFHYIGQFCPVDYRRNANPLSKDEYTGCRAAFYIE